MVGIGGISPQVFVRVGAIPSGERFVWTREQQPKAPRVHSGALAAPPAQRGHCQEQRGRLKWLQAVPGTQSVVTGAGSQDVEQQQDVVWQLKQHGVQEGTATLLLPELSSPRAGSVFFTCPA